jgi:hypothetical protein
MRTACTLALVALLAACASATAGGAGTSPASRDALWRQGHQALREDSGRVAMAAFQRLAAEHPQAREGIEARFYLATLYLDPRAPTFDAQRAVENLDLYLAADTAGGRATRRPEAMRLLPLARELVLPCDRRTGPLRCTPVAAAGGRDTVVVRTPSGDGSSAEVARLRRELAERDATIRELREELQRIRNTLAPRPRR